MAFLNSLISANTVQAPTGLWEWLILTGFDFVVNYGWRVVLFTVCLKLLLSPLDIYQRYKARKNEKIMRRIKPQLEKLQKQYPDKTEFQRKQMELQKKEGYSMFSSCLPSILTLVIFITLLVGLNNISAYMNFKEYKELYDVYNVSVQEYATLSDAEKGGMSETEYAQDKVYDAYHENKISWLWVGNIWSPDVPWKSEVNDYNTFKANIADYGTNANKSGMTSEEVQDMLTKYNTVMGKLLSAENNKANGYLVLPILSVILSVATQWIAMRQQKKSGQVVEGTTGASSMKMMMYIMPIMIGIFSLSYTAAFAMYLVFNYLVSLVITLGAALILTIIDKHEEKVAKETVHKYGRPDPNDINE